MKMVLKSLDTVRKRTKFSEINNNKFNINKNLKDSDKNL